MVQGTKDDPGLAATILFLLGEPVPHDPKRESEAGKRIDFAASRENVLLEAVALCGRPDTPGRLYLCEKAASRLGKPYCRETIRLADQYLKGEEWAGLPRGAEVLDGISVDDRDALRAGVLLDLAAAREEAGEGESAYSAYLAAYELIPHNAMVAVKAADLLARIRGRKEALNFLLEQRGAFYYKPVRYRDSFGNIRWNGVFRDMIEAQIRKLLKKTPDSPTV